MKYLLFDRMIVKRVFFIKKNLNEYYCICGNYLNLLINVLSLILVWMSEKNRSYFENYLNKQLTYRVLIEIMLDHTRMKQPSSTSKLSMVVWHWSIHNLKQNSTSVLMLSWVKTCWGKPIHHFMRITQYLRKIWKSYTNLSLVVSIIPLILLFFWMLSVFHFSAGLHPTSYSCYILIISIRIGSAHQHVYVEVEDATQLLKLN